MLAFNVYELDISYSFKLSTGLYSKFWSRSYRKFCSCSTLISMKFILIINSGTSQINFLICFPMDYRDFSVKSKVIISLFETVRLSLSSIKYYCSLLIRFQLAKSNLCVSEITSRTFACHLDIDDVTYSDNVT